MMRYMAQMTIHRGNAVVSVIEPCCRKFTQIQEGEDSDRLESIF